MVKIAAKARKVGNSFVITIPTDLSNQLELILDKLNEESIKERELRAKYDYYSKDGEIYLDKKKIGTVVTRSSLAFVNLW